VGCALAHRHDDTIVVDLRPDGDFLYTSSALWTAAAQSLPPLIVVANNRTYNQDRMHQSELGRAHGRGVDPGSGIDITAPDVDFASLARGQDVAALGPVGAPPTSRPSWSARFDRQDRGASGAG
jgi:acetolactate synthase-1/2/3 large subunit